MSTPCHHREGRSVEGYQCESAIEGGTQVTPSGCLVATVQPPGWALALSSPQLTQGLRGVFAEAQSGGRLLQDRSAQRWGWNRSPGTGRPLGGAAEPPPVSGTSASGVADSGPLCTWPSRGASYCAMLPSHVELGERRLLGPADPSLRRLVKAARPGLPAHAVGVRTPGPWPLAPGPCPGRAEELSVDE